ncbi:unnamed protein product [Darwinula stevensoni]|uniref:C2H2-type domain-containing protein n=1 Tax=Darwinula stevensoni TaxID=69355 RepID=A0A7R8X998_9CRUS|nr:unnamed protein product [Darwinula stevensoni]CAG0890453.1 unnamed protein product [Darwinula stevensoni]
MDGRPPTRLKAAGRLTSDLLQGSLIQEMARHKKKQSVSGELHRATLADKLDGATGARQCSSRSSSGATGVSTIPCLFVCPSCNKECKTKSALLSHLRFKHPPNVSPSVPEHQSPSQILQEVFSYPCTECERSFPTKIGHSLHLKARHPNKYYSEQVTTQKKSRWDEEEDLLLANAELQALKTNIKNINQHILATNILPGRTLESIKGRRKQTKYLDLLSTLQQEIFIGNNTEHKQEEETIQEPEHETLNWKINILKHLKQIPSGEGAKETELDQIIDVLNISTLDNNTIMDLLDKQAEAKPPPKQFIAKKSTMLDGRGLRFSKEVPYNHSWKTDGNKLQSGTSFINSVKVHGNLLPTQARASRGRNETPMCDAGCNSRASLSHIAQACCRTHNSRIKRHDALVNFIEQQFHRLGYTTIKEPKIITSAGLRKPDLIVNSGLQTHVLDAQIINDYDDPETLHQKKKQYYDNEDITNWVKIKTNNPSVSFSTITFNWRGCMSNSSYNDLRALGLTKRDLVIATVRILEMTHACWRIYTQSTLKKRGRTQ